MTEKDAQMKLLNYMIKSKIVGDREANCVLHYILTGEDLCKDYEELESCIYDIREREYVVEYGNLTVEDIHHSISRAIFLMNKLHIDTCSGYSVDDLIRLNALSDRELTGENSRQEKLKEHKMKRKEETTAKYYFYKDDELLFTEPFNNLFNNIINDMDNLLYNNTKLDYGESLIVILNDYTIIRTNSLSDFSKRGDVKGIYKIPKILSKSLYVRLKSFYGLELNNNDLGHVNSIYTTISTAKIVYTIRRDKLIDIIDRYNIPSLDGNKKLYNKLDLEKVMNAR